MKQTRLSKSKPEPIDASVMDMCTTEWKLTEYQTEKIT